jgi:hypothetical protein
MSAYIVSNETINCIVHGMIDNRIIGILSAEEIGQALLDQNYASVNYRYDEQTKPEKFRFERKGDMFGGILIDVANAYTDTEIYGCIQCWQYQSCEDPNHRETEAWRRVERLEYALVEKKFPDYPWGL